MAEGFGEYGMFRYRWIKFDSYASTQYLAVTN